MHINNTYTTTTPWGHTYQICALSLEEAKKLIVQYEGRELEQYSKILKYGRVFQLNNGQVIIPSYSDALLYDTLQDFFSNLQTSGMFIQKHISSEYPIPLIAYGLDGKRIIFYQVSPEQGAVATEIAQRLYPEDSTVFITHDQEIVKHVAGGMYFLFNNIVDFQSYQKVFERLKEFGPDLVAEPAVVLEMCGRNPFGQSFSEHVDGLISSLPELLHAPEKTFTLKINSLPKIDNYFYRNLITAEFGDRIFLPLLAYIGQTHIQELGGQWYTEQNKLDHGWIPDIVNNEGQKKRMYQQLLKILDPLSKDFYPLATVLHYFL